MEFRIICLILTLIAAASASPSSRIVGGTPTTIFEYPFVVSVEYHYPAADLRVQRCVGSLISSWHALTAAYCFTDAALNSTSIRAGSSTSLVGGTVVSIREVILHPDYVENPRTGDIAIVVLTAPLALTAAINIAYIPPQQTFIPDGYPVEIVSWGSEFVDGPQIGSLQKINSNVVAQAQCEAAYEENENVVIYDQVLCAASEGTSVCTGDSGAPLIIGETLIGLSSYFTACDDSTPDVFTRVDRHTGWILEHAVPPNGKNADASIRIARSVL
ncbi:trypsin delta-like [Galleria mellonella]|uniref:Trypsin delta-like n=1 Tax=Galleria mellonella TaxID=7137 RepID=A0ABM3MNW3_GALME|nr:trypsin delta-like [Galleria mellonella]